MVSAVDQTKAWFNQPFTGTTEHEPEYEDGFVVYSEFMTQLFELGYIERDLSRADPPINEYYDARLKEEMIARRNTLKAELKTSLNQRLAGLEAERK